jgi:hypothetical protein
MTGKLPIYVETKKEKLKEVALRIVFNSVFPVGSTNNVLYSLSLTGMKSQRANILGLSEW